jgi:hypothetical protein
MAAQLSPEALVSALAARGVPASDAREAALLSGARSADAAAVALAGAAGGRCAWRELFSTRYAGRPYYHNAETGATAWEARAFGALARGTMRAPRL